MTNETAYAMEQFWNTVNFQLQTNEKLVLMAAAGYLAEPDKNSLLQVRQDICNTLFHDFPMQDYFAKDGRANELKKCVAALVDIGIAQILAPFPELPYANSYWKFYRTKRDSFPVFPPELKEDLAKLAEDSPKEDGGNTTESKAA